MWLLSSKIILILIPRSFLFFLCSVLRRTRNIFLSSTYVQTSWLTPVAAAPAVCSLAILAFPKDANNVWHCILPMDKDEYLYAFTKSRVPSYFTCAIVESKQAPFSGPAYLPTMGQYFYYLQFLPFSWARQLLITPSIIGGNAVHCLLAKGVGYYWKIVEKIKRRKQVFNFVLPHLHPRAIFWSWLVFQMLLENVPH